MNLCVYLPNALGAKAKEAELPFSRLLRAAVERELAKMAELDRIAAAWPYSPASNQDQERDS